MSDQKKPTYEQALQYQQIATHCVFCGRELTDADSIERSCGAVCAEKHGYYNEPGPVSEAGLKEAFAAITNEKVKQDLTDVLRAAMGEGGSASARAYVGRHGAGFKAVAQRAIYHGSLITSYGSGTMEERGTQAAMALVSQACGYPVMAEAIVTANFGFRARDGRQHPISLKRSDKALASGSAIEVEFPFDSTVVSTFRSLGGKWSPPKWLVPESRLVEALNALICAFPGFAYVDVDGKVAVLPAAPVPVPPAAQPPPGAPVAQTGESPLTPEMMAQYRVGQRVKLGEEVYYVRWLPGPVSDGDTRVGLAKTMARGAQFIFTSVGQTRIVSWEAMDEDQRRRAEQAVEDAGRAGVPVTVNDLGQGAQATEMPGGEATGLSEAAPQDDDWEMVEHAFGDDWRRRTVRDERGRIRAREQRRAQAAQAGGEAKFTQFTEMQLFDAKARYIQAVQDIELYPNIQRLVDGKPKRPAEPPSAIPQGLHPYQVEAVRWLDRRGSGLVCYEQGLGKTIVAITAMTLPAIVVCTKATRLNWQKETLKWRPGLKTYCPKGEETLDERTIRNVDVLFVTYRNLQAIGGQLFPDLPQGKDKKGTPYPRSRPRKAAREKRWSMLICDESQYIKGGEMLFHDEEGEPNGMYGGTAQAAIAMQISMHVPRVVLLSGTPIKNRSDEFWPQLHMIDPTFWRSQSKFNALYCKEKKRTKISAPTDTDMGKVITLNHLIFEPNGRFAIRKRKEEVGGLPEKRRDAIEVQLQGPRARQYRKAAIDFLEWLIKTRGNADNVKSIKHLILVQMTMLRRLAAIAKVPFALQWIDRHFDESDRPLMIMGWHQEPLQEIAKACEGAGLRTAMVVGDVDERERFDNVEDFQRGKLDVIICSIPAAKEGITLTAACDGLFVERAWSPADLVQAEDRLHRISQVNTVQITYIDAANTIDGRVAALLKSKIATVFGVLDGQELEDEEAAELVLGGLLGGQEGLAAFAESLGALKEEEEGSGGFVTAAELAEEAKLFQTILKPRKIRRALRALPVVPSPQRVAEEQKPSEVISGQPLVPVDEVATPVRSRRSAVPADELALFNTEHEKSTYVRLRKLGQHELADRILKAAKARAVQSTPTPVVTAPATPAVPRDPFDTPEERSTYERVIRAGRQDLADKILEAATRRLAAREAEEAKAREAKLREEAERARKEIKEVRKDLEETVEDELFDTPKERATYAELLRVGQEALAARLLAAFRQRAAARRQPAPTPEPTTRDPFASDEERSIYTRLLAAGQDEVAEMLWKKAEERQASGYKPNSAARMSSEQRQAVDNLEAMGLHDFAAKVAYTFGGGIFEPNGVDRDESIAHRAIECGLVSTNWLDPLAGVEDEDEPSYELP